MHSDDQVSKGLLKFKKYSVSVSETTYLLASLFYSLSLVTTFSHENLISTESILNRKHILFMDALSQGATTENNIISKESIK